MGHIFAFMTATRVDHDLNETHGWIDPNWSRTELLDSRNDAGPVVDADEWDEDLPELIRDAISEHLGAFEDNGDGTVYGADSIQKLDGVHWTYALHFVRKSYGVNGYIEQPWNPFTELDL